MVAFTVTALLISHPKAKFLVGHAFFLHSVYSAILHVPQRVSGILQRPYITEFVTHLGNEGHMFVRKKNVNKDSPSFLEQHNFTEGIHNFYISAATG